MIVRFPDLKASEAALLLPALEAINLLQLQGMAASTGRVLSIITDIQEGRIKYIRRDPGEEWLSLREIYKRGGGDCEDLAAGVAAELRFHGSHAYAFPYSTKINGLSHVVVKTDFWAQLLDPSRSAGMGSTSV